MSTIPDSPQSSGLLLPGAELAGYRVGSSMGAQHGVGRVYEAFDEGRGSRVALKAFNRHLADDLRMRFDDAVREREQLRHPNLARILDSGDDDGRLYLALTLILGPTLREAIDCAAIDDERALMVLGATSSALDTAHEAGLVYRGLKAESILGATGRPADIALGDFGVARPEDSSALIRSGRYASELDYMSPEETDGEPPSVASNVYSLAALVFEALTGFAPFSIGDEVPPWAVIDGHRSMEPPVLSRVRRDLPRELDEIIRSGLAKDPALRPVSAGELLAEIVRVYPPSAWSTDPRPGAWEAMPERMRVTPKRGFSLKRNGHRGARVHAHPGTRPPRRPNGHIEHPAREAPANGHPQVDEVREREAAEALRLEQERREAEARAAEEARLEEERRAAEEARLEQERREAEARAAEEARLEQERREAARAAEEARLEQERREAEARAAEEARLEQERREEEARRREEERREAEARAAAEKRRRIEEQERVERERQEAEERRAAEKRAAAERRAAEQRAEDERLEAERIAAEERRQAEERKAKEREARERVAAEQAARQREAEERKRAEKEAARQRRIDEKQVEKERRAAAKRQAKERKQAEKQAAEERRREDEARRAAQKQAAEEEKAAELRAADEKKAAERRAAEERKRAERRAQQEREAAEERAKAEKKAAVEHAEAEKRQAEERRAAEKKAAEERAQAEKRAAKREAEERRAAEKQAAQDQKAAKKHAAQEQKAAEKQADDDRRDAERTAVAERRAAREREHQEKRAAREREARRQRAARDREAQKQHEADEKRRRKEREQHEKEARKRAHAAHAPKRQRRGEVEPKPKTERSQRMARRRAGTTLFAAILVLGGVALGRVAAGGPETVAEAVPAGSTNGGPVGVSYPGDWKAASTAPRIPGLKLQDAIAVRPPGATGDTALVAGTLPAFQASFRHDGALLLPDRFLDRLDKDPSASDTVRLGELHAYRYADLQPKGLDSSLTLYVVPTSSGPAAVGCLEGAGAPAGFAEGCVKAASTLQLSGLEPHAIGPDRQFAGQLRRVMGRLNAARAFRRARLRDASTRNGQAAAAAALNLAYRDAARSLARVKAPPGAGPVKDGAVRALRNGAAGYLDMRAAATRRDRGLYNYGRTRVRRADGALQFQLRRFARLGYDPK